MNGFIDQEETTASLDLHTSDSPYCGEMDCWCHTDVAYHDEVTHPTATDDEIEVAYQFLGLSRH
jgi:hypothetical protein